MLFYSSHTLNRKKNGVRRHKRRKSKGAAQVLDTCPNWEFFTKTEKVSSALALIHLFNPHFSRNTSDIVLPPGPATGRRAPRHSPSSLRAHGDGACGAGRQEQVPRRPPQGPAFPLGCRLGYVSPPPNSRLVRKTTAIFTANSGMLFPPIYVLAYFPCVSVCTVMLAGQTVSRPLAGAWGPTVRLITGVGPSRPQALSSLALPGEGPSPGGRSGQRGLLHFSPGSTLHENTPLQSSPGQKQSWARSHREIRFTPGLSQHHRHLRRRKRVPPVERA